MVSQIHTIRITLVESEFEALLLEAFYIKKYKPKYNIRLTDNKSYIRIRITIKDVYPKVLLARREDTDDSVYFGPYPSSSAVKSVLKTIRRIFPFQSVPNHPKRICLYNHLGLCPCPPVNDSPALRKEYKKNIKGIIRILEGESKKVMKDLEKERDQLSAHELYEEAQRIQKRINALSLITTPVRRPFEYDANPNLRVDIRQQELNGLLAVLNAEGFFNITNLERIECYDISNIQGTNATASMVVFIHGEKDSSQYRKFKIRKTGKPNDFAMMKEVLTRRFKHDEWNTPDLIIVDGGKGQVNAGLNAMAQSGVVIPMIGLAKREETIIIPILPLSRPSPLKEEEATATPSPSQGEGWGEGKKDAYNNQTPNTYKELINYHFLNTEDDSKTLIINEDNFTEVSLPKNSPSLHLLQRIRDEAHRFAITYHRKLRSKNALLQ